MVCLVLKVGHMSLYTVTLTCSIEAESEEEALLCFLKDPVLYIDQNVEVELEGGDV